MEHLSFDRLHRINGIFAEMDALYHQAALRLGLSDSALRVLYALYDDGGSCALTAVCRQSGLSKQTVNSALRKLEREGTIYLERAGGREKRACLTAAGEALAQRTVARLYAAESAAFSDWPEEEICAHIRYLESYLDAFRTQVARLQPGEDEGQ